MNHLSLLEQRKIEARVLVPLIQAFEVAFGEAPTREIVKRVVSELARARGEELARGNAASPLEIVKELVPAFSEGEALDVQVRRDSESNYDFDVCRCKFAEFYKELGVPELGFLLSCSRDFELAEGLADDLELKRTQTIMEGAPHCDFRFAVKSRGSAGSDPVKG